MGLKSIFNKIITRFERYIRDDGANIISIIFHNHVFIYIYRYYYKFIFGWDVRSISGQNYIRGSKYISIGSNFCCKGNLWLEAVTEFNGERYFPKVLIGDNFSGGLGLHIASTHSIVIGNNVLVGSKVLITDHLHGIYNGFNQCSPMTPPNVRPLTSDKFVVIEDNVFIGDNVCVLPGVTIGFGAIIAANSVVTSDVPKNVIVAGNPAIVIKKFIEIEKKWIRV